MKYDDKGRKSQWPSRLRRQSTADRLLGLRIRIPPAAWLSVCCEWCVLSGRGLCDELIPRPEEFYRQWCVIACDLETSIMRRPWPALGCRARGKAMIVKYYTFRQVTREDRRQHVRRGSTTALNSFTSFRVSVKLQLEGTQVA